MLPLAANELTPIGKHKCQGNREMLFVKKLGENPLVNWRGKDIMFARLPTGGNYALFISGNYQFGHERGLFLSWVPAPNTVGVEKVLCIIEL
jgi:hypothetical protein